MIATKRFVFVQLPRTGGEFINGFLLRFFPSARAIGLNLPRLMIPPEYSGLPVLGFVRNPWHYYASWYDFQSSLPWSNALFRILSDEGRLGFDATIRNMLNLGMDGPLLDRLMAALPNNYGSSGLNLPKFALAPIRDSGRGFFSHLYDHHYGAHDRLLHVARIEEVATSLAQSLERFGERVTDAMYDYIRDNRRIEQVSGGPYVDRYSPDLRDLVLERDMPVITRHAYRFGD